MNVVVRNGCRRFIQTGMGYYRFFPMLAERIKCKTYFEIGVRNGRSLRLIEAAAVGVDPAFSIKVDVIGNKPSLQLFQMTSDEFFARHELSELLPNSYDLAFLDGMHKFEFLLRDFINTEASAREGSMILLHDCFPINAEMTEREEGSVVRRDRKFRKLWTGDVWKMMEILREYRPNLKVACLDCRPTGLAAITQLDAKSTVLRDNYDKIVNDYMMVEMTDASLEGYFERHPITAAEDYLNRVRL